MAAEPTPAVAAMVVVTDLVVISRHLTVLAEIAAKGLEPVLVVGPETEAEELARIVSDPRHPLSSVRTIVHVADTDVVSLSGAIIEIAAAYEIKALLNVGEVFVESAGVLADVLGLPGPGAYASRVARDKLLQRLAVPELAPRWALARSGAPAIAPGVLKPTGRMSSSGVRRIDSQQDLDEALPDYPEHETLLIEELVEAPEFSVESLVRNGEVVWAGVTAKRTNEDGTDSFTEMGHVSPAAGLSAQDERALLDANRTLLERLRFGSGMAHAEFRAKDGVVTLMEIAARPPGDAITILWHLATGQPIEPALVDLALGIRPPARAVRRRAEQIYLDHPQGTLTGVEGGPTPVFWVSSSRQWPRVEPAGSDGPARACAVVATREPGDLLGAIRSSADRSASVIVDYPLSWPGAGNPGGDELAGLLTAVTVTAQEAAAHD